MTKDKTSKQRQVYLDHAAATPVDSDVLKAMLPFYQDRFYNPSALYTASREVKQSLDDARQTVARTLGVQPAEIVFTAGGTEANNLAIQGVMTQYPNAHLLVGATEHDSVLKTAVHHRATVCPVNAQGKITPEALRAGLQADTVLVSIMLTNNEVGTIQDISALAAVLQEVREQRTADSNDLPLWLHVDASQSANHMKLAPKKMQCDLMTLNGGKLYGPKQTGCLFMARQVRLQPLIYGGGQERNLRSGTENIAGCIGFSQALAAAQARVVSETKRLRSLQQLFHTMLARCFPQVIIHSRNSQVNFVHCTFPGVDNERLVMELDERGVQCAVGSACSASSDEPSHVLSAMGLSRQDIQSSVRFTMGRETTEADIDYVIECLKEVITPK